SIQASSPTIVGAAVPKTSTNFGMRNLVLTGSEIRTIGIQCRLSASELPAHDPFAFHYNAGVGEAQLLVKGARASLAGTDAGQKLARARPLAHVRDHLLKGLSPIAVSLKSMIDHESPQTILPLCRLVVEHHKADRRVICVNGTEPRDLAIEVRLRDRDGIGGDEALLLWRDLQL